MHTLFNLNYLFLQNYLKGACNGEKSYFAYLRIIKKLQDSVIDDMGSPRSMPVEKRFYNVIFVDSDKKEGRIRLVDVGTAETVEFPVVYVHNPDWLNTLWNYKI
jgi:hypothetical protein